MDPFETIWALSDGAPPPLIPDTDPLMPWRRTNDGELAIVVRSTLEADFSCPHCGKPRQPNGTRLARIRDMPHRGQPVFFEWKRQQYRCRDGCGRASNEEHPEIDERHFLTRRLIERVLHEGARRPFVAIAEECGLSERLVRRIFHEATGKTGFDLAGTRVLALHNIPLASRDRPAAIDVETRSFQEVFSSPSALAAAFAIWDMEDQPVSNDVEVLILDVALLNGPQFSADDFEEWFPRAKLLVSGISIAREATRMIAEACRPLLESCASQEKSTAKSALALFMRDGRRLGDLARQRVKEWKTHAPDLHQAYELKNRLAELLRVRSLNERHWGRWKEAARLLSSVETTPVVELVETRWLQLLAYEEDESLGVFEFWFNEVASKIDVQGGHSFSAARVAFLEQNKKRPGAKRAF